MDPYCLVDALKLYIIIIGRSLNFPSAQSSFEILLSTAKLRSAGSGTHFATSPHEVWGVTETCCSGTPVSFANYTKDTS